MKWVKRKPFIPSSTHFQTWPSVDPQAPAPSASWESWQTGSCHCWPLSWRAELRCWPFPLWCKHGSLSGTLVAPGRQKIYFIRSAIAGIEFPTGLYSGLEGQNTTHITEKVGLKFLFVIVPGNSSVSMSYNENVVYCEKLLCFMKCIFSEILYFLKCCCVLSFRVTVIWAKASCRRKSETMFNP